MTVYQKFIRVDITPEMQKIAQQHAERRTALIVRQFVPRNSPLSHIESNYIGALGEVVIRCYFELNMSLADNYEAHQVDSGDIIIRDKIYDIKAEAIPNKYYRKLYYGKILPYEPYGCRVWTAKHEHHLGKYTGGIIFVAIPIPNNAKDDKKPKILRERIVDHVQQAIIIGYVDRNVFNNLKPSWYSPRNPVTGKRRKYNSPNYIFHHSKISSLKKLKGDKNI
jgi:hypothetical protein